jgi:hypothetical protein
MSKELFEPVYSVAEFFDQPRSGVAACAGRPQLFESEWDEHADDYGATFLLWPLDERTLDLVKEQWSIWLRWDEAFHSGQADLATHPALPEDRERSQQLQKIIEDRFAKAKVKDPSRKTAKFRKLDRQNYEVQWSEEVL